MAALVHSAISAAGRGFRRLERSATVAAVLSVLLVAAAEPIEAQESDASDPFRMPTGILFCHRPPVGDVDRAAGIAVLFQFIEPEENGSHTREIGVGYSESGAPVIMLVVMESGPDEAIVSDAYTIWFGADTTRGIRMRIGPRRISDTHVDLELSNERITELSPALTAAGYEFAVGLWKRRCAER